MAVPNNVYALMTFAISANNPMLSKGYAAETYKIIVNYKGHECLRFDLPLPQVREMFIDGLSHFFINTVRIWASKTVYICESPL